MHNNRIHQISRNINTVEDMKKDIMATYYHLCSTDEKPRHEYCPLGPDSWCKWQKGQITDAHFERPVLLHPEVQKYILPIYEDLTNKNLLQRCLDGHTQNANESFNSTVWRFAPKHLHFGLKIIKIAAYTAAGIFNEGYSSILQNMACLNITIGKQCKSYADRTDESLIKRQERFMDGNPFRLMYEAASSTGARILI
jgi:hypothetical protein